MSSSCCDVFKISVTRSLKVCVSNRCGQIDPLLWTFWVNWATGQAWLSDAVVIYKTRSSYPAYAIVFPPGLDIYCLQSVKTLRHKSSQTFLMTVNVITPVGGMPLVICLKCGAMWIPDFIPGDKAQQMSQQRQPILWSIWIIQAAVISRSATTAKTLIDFARCFLPFEHQAQGV